jgi:Tfp pilus assembly protein PilO
MHAETYRKIDGLLPAALLCAAAAAVMGLVLHLGVAPAWQALQDKRARMHHVRRRIEQESGHESLMREITAKHDSLDAKLATLTSGMGDAGDLSGLLQMIFDMAYAAGIQFDRTEPREETRGESFIRYPILFETTAEYAALGTFIASLERLPQAFRIDRLAMTALADGDVRAALMVTCFLDESGASHD